MMWNKIVSQRQMECRKSKGSAKGQTVEQGKKEADEMCLMCVS